MKKIIKYGLLMIAVLLFAFKGIYFQKLDVHNTKATTDLNPADFANKFWQEKLQPAMENAVEINTFLADLKANPKEAIDKYSKTKGITNTVYILLKGEGIIADVKPDFIVVSDDKNSVKLNSGIYFGNAVRDVTGQIAMGDFSNTIDFNNVSMELNKIVKAKVVEPLKANATKGQSIKYAGILELNKENIKTDHLELLPLFIRQK